MLASLTIQNVVLIDRLTLEGVAGLSALTGETGAGKSILLDALGLTLGARADAGLVRHGEEQASVTAVFDLPPAHPVFAILLDKGIDAEGSLILRRTVAKDGRSKAFINDSPVSAQTLKDAAAQLVEIHGQFATQGLLDPATHLDVLDGYAGTTGDVKDVHKAYDVWKTALSSLDEARASIDVIKSQEEYLRHTVAELEELDPEVGEEDILAEKRQRLLLRQKMHSVFDQSTQLLDSEDGIQDLIGKLETSLERIAKQGGDDIKPLIESLGRARIEINDISYSIEKLRHGGNASEDRLEDVEDRYFSLKACAKKHRVLTDQLPEVWADLAARLKMITHQDDALAELERNAETAKRAYLSLAEKLSQKRTKIAQKLAKAVNLELPDLKLDKAKFDISCTRASGDNAYSSHGIDIIQFMVSTNTGTPVGPLHKIASGGELSRFMLALKVILAETGSIPTLIFDEADSGIGGATADAVGERLQRLAKKYQVLTVTHSPQVAARASVHWHVAKAEKKGVVTTNITPLATAEARAEEIARMLSGAEITVEARAQAQKLLEKQNAA